MSMDLSQARIGQKDALRIVIDRMRNGEKETAIVLPTGYGKSDLIRMIAFQLWDMRLCSCTLVLSPNEYLRDQLVDKKRFLEFASRYQVAATGKRPLKYGELRSIPKDGKLAPNGEFFLSTTIQNASRNIESIVNWMTDYSQETGLPEVLIVDETHTGSEVNVWGKSAKAGRDAGAHLIVLTATPMREDGQPLVGFETRTLDIEPVTITKTRPGSTENTVQVQIWDGVKKRVELVPHYRKDFKDAWDEGVLCHVNHHPVDVQVCKVGGEGGDTRLLSELTETEVRRALGRMVRHPEVVRLGCEELVQWIRLVRGSSGVFGQDCAGIVFCCNDTEEDDSTNEHAMEIKRRLAQIDSSLRVMIATSASEGKPGEKSGKHILEDFSNKGVGDIVIVKQMASVGMDCPRIKVSLDLSPVRTPLAFIQRVNRATRPYKGITVSHLITPADVLSEACFHKFIESEGGSTTETVRLREEYEKEKEENPKTLFVFHSPAVGDVKDTKGGHAARNQLSTVLAVVDAFPMLLATCTIPDIADRLTAFQSAPYEPETVSPEAENTTQVADGNKLIILDRVKQITNIRIARQGRSYSKAKEDKNFYGKAIKAVWKEAYKLAGVPDGFDYQRSTDAEALRAVLAAVDAIHDEETSR